MPVDVNETMIARVQQRHGGGELQLNRAFAGEQRRRFGELAAYERQHERAAVERQLDLAQDALRVRTGLLRREPPVAIAIDLREEAVRDRDAGRQDQRGHHAPRLDGDPRSLQILVAPMR